MVQMSEAQRDAVHRRLMRHLSEEWIECSLSKGQLRAAVSIFDAGLESAESSILNSVSQDARTWLLNNVTQARWIMDNVAQARTEVLGG